MIQAFTQEGEIVLQSHSKRRLSPYPFHVSAKVGYIKAIPNILSRHALTKNGYLTVSVRDCGVTSYGGGIPHVPPNIASPNLLNLAVSSLHAV